MARMSDHYGKKDKEPKEGKAAGTTEEKEVKSEAAPSDKDPKPEPVEVGAMGEVHHRMADHAAMMGRHLADHGTMHLKHMAEHAAHADGGDLKALHAKHEEERKGMHSRHMAEMRGLHDRHEKSPAEKIVEKK